MQTKEMYEAKIYWEGRLAKGFNLNSVGFDSFGSNFNRWIYRMAKRNLELAIKSGLINPEGKSVLDIGCGTGFYVDIWKEHGIGELVGIDIARESVSRLEKEHPEYRFYQQDVGERFSHSQSYDIITAFAVLFHIVDDAKFGQALKNIRNLCHSDSVVLITDIFPHKRAYTLPHQKSRILAEYERVLMANGLRITGRLPVHYLLNAPLDISNAFVQWLALNVWWKFIVGGLELTTHIMGVSLYALDCLLTRILRESPSTEMLICRKI